MEHANITFASIFNLHYTIAKQKDLLSCTSRKFVCVQKKRDSSATPVFKLSLSKRKYDSQQAEVYNYAFDPIPSSVVASSSKPQKLLQQGYTLNLSQSCLPICTAYHKHIKTTFFLSMKSTYIKRRKSLFNDMLRTCLT